MILSLFAIAKLIRVISTIILDTVSEVSNTFLIPVSDFRIKVSHDDVK